MFRMTSSTRPISARNARRVNARKGDMRGGSGGDFGGGAPAGFQGGGNDSGGQQGNNSGGNGNNGGGNQGGGNGSESGGNNTGPAFDPEAFWNPAPAGGEGAPGGNPGSAAPSTPDANAALGTELQQGLAGFDGGANFMTPDMANQMANGDFKSFNEGLNQYGQNVMRSTLGMSVKIMKAMRDQIMQETRNGTQQEFGNRENLSALQSDIPSTKNPAILKIVQPIFDQAMTLSKGDRKAALVMTKQMMKFQTETLSADDSLGIPPRNPGDSAAPNINWLEELMGR